MKNKYVLYPVIMSISALFCFVVVFLFFAGAVQPLWGRMMLLILPALLLGIVAFFAVKGKMSAASTTIWTTVLSIVLLVASVFYIFILWTKMNTTTTTDIRYYSRAYAQIDEVDEVRDVFPETIPTDAKNIKFTYFPKYLQGAGVFELSYTTTDDKLAEWTTRLKSKAEWVGSNENWYIENNWSYDGINAMRYQLYWNGGFNHGEMCYVLISEELKQITFSYSIW